MLSISCKMGLIAGALLLVSNSAGAQCIPADFMVQDKTHILWTEQLKIAFLLTATREQYEAVRQSWNVAGGYGLFYGSLDYDQAKAAALRESQTRKLDYDYSTYLDYTSQRLSPEATKMYADCLGHDRNAPGLVLWVEKRERGVYYTLSGFWVGGNEVTGEGKEKKLIVDGAQIIQKPINWPKASTRQISLKRLSPDKDAYLSLEVSGQTKTIFLLADLPEPSKAVVTFPNLLGVTSGGTSDGHSPWCQRRTVSGCVHPKMTGGYLEVGSGHLVDVTTSGRTGWSVIRDTPEEICVELWASTGACETQVSISGRPAANERYIASGVPASTAGGVPAGLPASIQTAPTTQLQAITVPTEVQ